MACCHHHPSSSHRSLLIAVGILLGFAGIEWFAARLSHSLALLSDAGHMASDALSLSIAAFAAWLAQKPASQHHTYGFGRAEIIAAWMSSLTLVALSIAIIIAAIHRLQHPPIVQGHIVMWVSLLGLAVNIGIALLLAHNERTLNVRAALLHVMSDILGSITALIAGAVIVFQGWLLIDPILSIAIGLMILLASLRLIKESLHILMERAPAHINSEQVGHSICQFANIQGVHDLHIWTLNSGKVALSAHIELPEGSMNQWPLILETLTKQLAQTYAIDHITIQPEQPEQPCYACPPPPNQGDDDHDPII